mgnify:CR=1 FL=1
MLLGCKSPFPTESLPAENGNLHLVNSILKLIVCGHLYKLGLGFSDLQRGRFQQTYGTNRIQLHGQSVCVIEF